MEKQNTIRNISLIIPSYNTEKHLVNTYNSVRKYYKDVEMVIINDGSTDNTSEWLDALKDNNVIKINSKERKGHTFFYDEGMRHATNEIVGILHSDMIIGPNYLENMLKNLERGKVICATRIEPPIHPPGKEKIVMDFGMDHNDLKLDDFEKFCIEKSEEFKDITTKGIFAPWILHKEDHFAIGGHDQTFAPYGYEDSDIFNRWILAGYKMVQSRDAFVYHLTCRGHRWNKGVGIVNDDYESTMNRCRRDFIRKWGDWIKNDEYQFPIINPKYDIGFIIQNPNLQLLEVIEPWCSRIYISDYEFLSDTYLKKEQPNTSFDLNERVKPFDNEKNNEILVTIDGNKFTQQDFQYIQQLPEILADSGEPAFHGELGNITIEIFEEMNTFEEDLICITNSNNEEN
jgi:glycosyltransferase involved in cell wall biosynthesis